jgi:hypothetical protein
VEVDVVVVEVGSEDLLGDRGPRGVVRGSAAEEKNVVG